MLDFWPWPMFEAGGPRLGNLRPKKGQGAVSRRNTLVEGAPIRPPETNARRRGHSRRAKCHHNDKREQNPSCKFPQPCF